MERISSRRNSIVLACRDAASRRPPERMLLDGLRLVREAARAGLMFDVVVFAERLLNGGEATALADDLTARGIRVVRASASAMEAVSPTSTPQGVVALAGAPAWTWSDLFRSSPALLVIAVDVQDPGNVGSIVRAAEAGGAGGVIVSGVSADPLGWKALRGAMGSAFRLPLLVEREPAGVLASVRARGVPILLADPHEGVPMQAADLARPLALVVGGEGPGLRSELRPLADGFVTIPMQPPVESLNVAVATAVLVYEAGRQRAMVRPI